MVKKVLRSSQSRLPLSLFHRAPQSAHHPHKKDVEHGKWNPDQKNSSRLELSISKNTPHGRWGQGPGSVDPRFPAGLPFPVPEILEFVAFCDPGKIFQQFSRDFPGLSSGSPEQTPETAPAFSSCLTWGLSFLGALAYFWARAFALLFKRSLALAC